jgi:hypothetical protein
MMRCRAGLFLLLLAALSLSLTGGKEDVITWKADRKLTWEDYRGKPQKRFAAASTVYSLGRYVYARDGKVYALVEAYFYCKDSWKKVDWINDEVLAHEQKHFDLVELFARRMRKQLTGMVFTGLKDAAKKVEALYKLTDKELDAWQDKYDDESDGSMNGEGQRKWNRKIEAELQDLSNYQEPVVELKLALRH